MRAEDVSLGFSTYTYGKVFLVGPGLGGGSGPSISQCSFDKAMALSPTASGDLRISTAAAAYRLANALRESGGPFADARGARWDRVLAPREAHFTGRVDAHELVETPDGRVLAACTALNCVAQLDPASGSLSPVWMPPFLTAVRAEDCCHLNGFCMDPADPTKLAYATVVGPADEKDGWRQHRAGGGQVWDCRTNTVVCAGLSMPHSPRMHEGKLWLLEAGTGWLGWVNMDAATPEEAFVRHAWLPGFARGLRFSPSGAFAVVGLSMPRYSVFSDLPLGQELERRKAEPRCGVYVVDLRTGKPAHAVVVGGAIHELYDVAVLEGTGAPMVVGASRPETERWIKIGDNATGREVDA